MTFSDEMREPRQPFLLAPWPVLFLIGLLAACYVAVTLAPAAMQDQIIYDYGFIPARYSAAFLAANPYSLGTVLDRALPFVTYIFLHANVSHLAINCIWLLPFGVVVARRFHALAFFTFFLLCGVLGAAVHLIFNWGSMLPVIGASAAISGLMGAAFRMMTLPTERWHRPDGSAQHQLAPLFSPRILLWSAVWVGVNVIAGVTGLGAGTQVRLIAWQAHMGGYFAGLLLAGPFTALARRLEAGARHHR